MEQCSCSASEGRVISNFVGTYCMVNVSPWLVCQVLLHSSSLKWTERIICPNCLQMGRSHIWPHDTCCLLTLFHVVKWQAYLVGYFFTAPVFFQTIQLPSDLLFQGIQRKEKKDKQKNTRSRANASDDISAVHSSIWQYLIPPHPIHVMKIDREDIILKLTGVLPVLLVIFHAAKSSGASWCDWIPGNIY